MESPIRELGVADIFVFRRVTHTRFVYVGGSPPAKTWAGPLAIDVDTDPLNGRLRIGQPLWMRYREPRRIFGPYYAATAAAVRLSQDMLVVFGAPEAAPGGFEPTAETLIAAAERAVEQAQNLAPVKHLADELEIVHARTELADRRGPDGTVEEALADVAEVAATALSCGIAVTWLPNGRLHVHEDGCRLPDRGTALQAVMHDLWGALPDLPLCVQDATKAPLAFPLDPPSGVRSYFVLPFGAPPAALVRVAHTDGQPPGFTPLNRTLAAELMGTADTVLARAVLREQLLRAVAEESTTREQLARANTELAKVALHDPLTGLPNRVLLQRHADGLDGATHGMCRSRPARGRSSSTPTTRRGRAHSCRWDPNATSTPRTQGCSMRTDIRYPRN